MSVKRYQFTIPGAENFSKPIRITGKSLIVEEIPQFERAAAVPELFFNQKGIPGSGAPLYPRGQLNNGENGFNTVFLLGTAESAGLEARLLVVENEILSTDIDPVTLGGFTGTTEQGDTYSNQHTDTVQVLPDSVLYDNGLTSGRKVSYAKISACSGALRWAVGNTVPTQNGIGHELLPDWYIDLYGFDALSTFSYISAQGGVPGQIHVSPTF